MKNPSVLPPVLVRAALVACAATIWLVSGPTAGEARAAGTCPPTTTPEEEPLGFGEGSEGQLDGLGDHLIFSHLRAGTNARVDILKDGRIYGYGNNDFGQLDYPDGLAPVRDVAIGLTHTVVLYADGTLEGFGNPEDGLTEVPGGDDFIAVSSGLTHSLALRADGTVEAWGHAADDKTLVPDTLDKVVAIAAGYEHSVALREDGTVVAWGYNGAGQASVPADLTGVASIAAGSSHTVALGVDGTITAWGLKTGGVTEVVPEAHGAVSLSAGEDYTLALMPDGSVVGWGDAFLLDVIKEQGPSGVTDLAAGKDFAVMVTATCVPASECAGGTACEGGECQEEDKGYSCVCGKGSGVPASYVTVGEGGPAPADGASPDAGSSEVLAAASHGDLVSFLFLDGHVDHHLEVDVPDDSDWIDVAAGSDFLLLLRADGSVAGFGAGKGAAVPGDLSHVAMVSAGDFHGAALTQAGGVVTWGEGAGSKYTPPAGFVGVVNVRAVGTYTVALSESGAVHVWGEALGALTEAKTIADGVDIQATANHLFVQRASGDWEVFAKDGNTGPYQPASKNELDKLIGVDGYVVAIDPAGQVLVWGESVPEEVPELGVVTDLVGGSTFFTAVTAPKCAGGEPEDPCTGGAETKSGGAGGTCGCPPGYEWDGAACVDIDECAVADPCDPNNQVCVNTVGGVECQCVSGWTESNPVHRIAGGGTYAAPTLHLDVISMDAGEGLGIAATADGRVVTWGDLLDPDVASGAANATDVALVAITEQAAFAVKNDGTTEQWLASGVTNFDAPPGAASPFTQVDGGRAFFCGRRADGTVAVWGVGYVPAGGPHISLIPNNAQSNVDKIVCSGHHAVALKDDGTVVVWGQTYSGGAAFQPPAGLAGVVDVAAGADNSAALHADGTVTVWGNAPALSVTDAQWLQAGHGGTQVLDASGTLLFSGSMAGNALLPPVVLREVHTSDWGGTIHGLSDLCQDDDECANGTANCPANAACINTVGSFVCECPAGYTYNPTTNACDDIDECAAGTHACDASNQQFCVNKPGTYECDCHPGYQRIQPLHRISGAGFVVAGAKVPVVEADLATQRGLAALATGRVVGFGFQLPPEVQQGIASVTDAVDVVINADAGAVLHADGTVTQWTVGGGLPYGAVPPFTSPVVQLSSATHDFCALHADGTASVWGWSTTLPQYHHLDQIPANATNLVQLECGGSHAVALRADGTLVTWGTDLYGQQIPAPQGLTGIVDIAAGRDHGLAVLSDGSTVSWGAIGAPVTTDAVVAEATSGASMILTSDGTFDHAGSLYLTYSSIPADIPFIDIVGADHGGAIGVRELCHDIDECGPGGGGWCGLNGVCINTPGSYLCDCDPGYAVNPATGLCEDVDECADGTHACDPASQLCINTPGSYDCSCDAGFTQNTPIVHVAGALQQPPTVNKDIVYADTWGRAHLAVLVDGSVFAWGPDQLPEIITGVAGITDAAMVAQVDRTAVVVHQDGTVSQITTLPGTSMPAPPALPASPIVHLAAGARDFCALHADGNITMWGWTQNLPWVTHNFHNIPAAVVAGDVVDLDCAEFTAIALLADGSVHTWGQMYSNGAFATPPPAGLTGVVDVAAGSDNFAALKSDGTVETWGNTTAFPVQNIVELDALHLGTAGLNASGQLSWGGNVGSYLYPLPPYPLTQLHTSNWIGTAIAVADMCQDQDECTDGTAVCPPTTTCVNTYGGYTCDCGPGYTFDPVIGQCVDDDECATGVGLCDAATQICVNTPGSWECQCAPGYEQRTDLTEWGALFSNPSALGEVVEVQGGFQAALVRNADGTIQAWGAGQSSVPPGLTNVVDIDLNFFTGLAVQAPAGTVVGWTSGPLYEVGQSTPPPGLSGVVQVAAGFKASYALKADGSIVAWGDNTFGQLNVPSMTNVVELAAGWHWAAALKADGTVTAWGAGTPLHVTANVGSLTNVVAIDVGKDHMLALHADGTVSALGDNGSGQLYLPVLPLPATQVFAGHWLSMILLSDGSVVGSGTNNHGQANPPAGLTGQDFVGAAVSMAFSIEVGCLDEDECATGTASCGPNSVCVNTIGSYQCDCLPGYVLNPATGQCEDEDECATGNHPCNPANQVCVNTIGSYQCDCDSGFQQVNPLRHITGALWQPPVVSMDVKHMDHNRRVSIAALVDGSVIAWGAEQEPAVINGVATITDAEQVAMGEDVAAVLHADGSVSQYSHLAPPQIGPLPTSWPASPIVQLDAGRWDFCAVHADGSLTIWGMSSTYNWITHNMANIPAAVTAGQVTRVSCSWQQAVALMADGSVITWGQNQFSAPAPAAPAGLTGVVDVVAGADNFAALKANGSIVTWGNAPALSTTDAVWVQATHQGTMALDSSGQVLHSGLNGGFLYPLPDYPFNEIHTDHWSGTSIGFTDMCIDEDECADGTAQCPPTTVCTNTYGGYTCDCPTGFTMNPATGLCEDDDECATGVAPCDPVTEVCVNIPGGWECQCAPGYEQRTDATLWGNYFPPNMPTSFGEVVEASAGYDFSLVRYADGTVQGWGAGPGGLVPPGLTGATDIDAGEGHGLAVIGPQGTVTAWGDNSFGKATPPAGLVNVVQVAGSDDASYAMRADGSIVGWGSNASGQLNIPTVADAVGISAGGSYAAVLRTTGEVVTWGGPTAPDTTSLQNVVAISAGHDHLLALRSDGTVAAVGDNFFGQSTVPALPLAAVAVSAAELHSMALLADGSVVSWGIAGNGVISPPQGLSGADVIAAGGETFQMAFDVGCLDIDECSDGTAGCGANSICTNTVASFTCTCLPGYVLNPATGDCDDIDECTDGTANCGPHSICTNLPGSFQCDCVPGYTLNPATGVCEDDDECTDGTASCGPNATCTNLPGSFQCDCLPGYVLNPATGLCEDDDECSTLPNACGPNATCANLAPGYDCLCGPGYTYSWTPFPLNLSGNPALDPPGTPVEMVQIAAGTEHAVALLANGAVTAWGGNTNGQASIPGGLPAAQQVAASDQTSIVLLTSGSTLAYGLHAGDFGGLTSIAKIAADGGHMLAIDNAGDVHAFGDNDADQATVPTLGAPAVEVAAGDSHSLALLSDGSVVGWGSNTYDAVTVPAAAAGAVDVAAGAHFSLAVTPAGSVVTWGNDPGGAGALFGWLATATDVASATARDESVLLVHGDGTVSTWDTTHGGVNHHAVAGASVQNGSILVSGPDCQDIDECTPPVSGPWYLGCDDNATCTNTPGSYNCDCDSGYTGNGFTCTQIDPCEPNPCANGAGCLPVFGGGFSCFCPPGWYGSLCDMPWPENCSNGIDDDGDGLADCMDPDCTSVVLCTAADPDKDGVSTGDELLCGTDPHVGEDAPGKDATKDLDGDGILDCADLDPDGDGLEAAAEATLGTDPMLADTDGDGLSDGEEDRNGDGKVDADETDPTVVDTDADGLGDGVEATSCYGVSKEATTCSVTLGWVGDSDGDGLPDGAEDSNGNGRVDAGETNPTLADSDGDGWSDPEEIECVTDPASAKSVPMDGDASGVCDGAETDSDGDGWSDGVEALCGTDPDSAGEAPRVDALGDYDGDGIINCLDGTVSTDGGTSGGGSGGAGVSCGAGSGTASGGWLLVLLATLALLLFRSRRGARVRSCVTSGRPGRS